MNKEVEFSNDVDMESEQNESKDMFDDDDSFDEEMLEETEAEHSLSSGATSVSYTELRNSRINFFMKISTLSTEIQLILLRDRLVPEEPRWKT